MIKLVKSTFFNEADTKQKLADFILKSEILSMGAEVKKFEEQFAKQQERKYAVMVNSGSSANLILLQSLVNLGRLKKSDRVGISAVTWSTNVMPVIQMGLIPVAIDCELETLNVSPKTLAPHVQNLRALFLTNVLGFCDDIAGIEKLCKENDVLLFEDNCESLGSKAYGRLLGNFGLAATFSFFVSHHLCTIEGGMVATDDEELYQQLLMTRAHGWDRNLPKEKQDELRKKHGISDFFAKFTFYDLSYNVRPTEIQGLLGTLQLPYLDETIKKRQENFKTIQAAVASNSELIPLKTDHMEVVSCFANPVVAKTEEIFKKYLKRFEENQVEVRPVIVGNITHQPFYKKYVSNKENCPNADIIHGQGFYFSNSPELTDEEVKILMSLLVK